MIMNKWLHWLLFILLIEGLANASIANELNFKDLNDTIIEGAFRGGKSGVGFTLLGVKRVVSQSKKSERLIFEIGDKNGEIYFGEPGYFQAQLVPNPPELTIDFSQMVSTKIDQRKLLQLFKKSKIIRKAKFRIDNVDNSTNLTLILNKQVKVRVYTLSPEAKSPKVVVDIISI